MTGPCKDCAERCLACHDTCGRYAQWRETKAEADRRRKAEDQLNRDIRVIRAYPARYRSNLTKPKEY